MRPIFLSLVLVSLFFLVSCINTQKSCNLDSDCVSTTCCHATDAINKEFGSNCAGQLCSQECVPETTDCGQGEIKCLENECKVVLD
ncbi:MAG TPA: hypothetical protein VJA23_04085 [Candidatus Nanoarchaeia archaeon]|nr:hypothetical protein [Candidatus Nanoarchaeia archaeon]